MSDNITIKYIMEHKNEINADIEAGMESAIALADMYAMHRSCPSDPGAAAFLDCYLDEYLQAKEVEADEDNE